MIKIKNIYYMLSYAYSVLQEDGYKSILTEEFDHVADLFAAILDTGISIQIKRGLARDYIEKSEEVSVPVGKDQYISFDTEADIFEKSIKLHLR